MARASYDKQAVLKDIAEQKLSPDEIAEKHGISVGNVYNIKAVAKRRGSFSFHGDKSIEERLQDENSVLTPELREKIKDLREDPQAYTSTEIAAMLGLDREDVIKVMARAANEYARRGGGKSSGKVRVQVVD